MTNSKGITDDEFSCLCDEYSYWSETECVKCPNANAEYTGKSLSNLTCECAVNATDLGPGLGC